MYSLDTAQRGSVFEAIKGALPTFEDKKFLELGKPSIQNEIVTFDSKLFINRKTPFVLNHTVIITQPKGDLSSKQTGISSELSGPTLAETSLPKDENLTGGQKVKPFLDDVIADTQRTSEEIQAKNPGILGKIKEGYQQIVESIKDEFRPVDKTEIDQGEANVQRTRPIIDLKTGKQIGQKPIHGTMANP